MQDRSARIAAPPSWPGLTIPAKPVRNRRAAQLSCWDGRLKAGHDD
jgi:hypothetical protein